MNRYLIAALVIVITGNAFVLARTVYNRSAVIHELRLSERELHLPYNLNDYDSQLSLTLNWQTLQVPRMGFGTLLLIDDRFDELGFNPVCRAPDDEMPRPTWFLLELDGTDYQRQLALIRQARERMSAINEDTAQLQLSRLFIADVGESREALLARAGGRENVAVVPGLVHRSCDQQVLVADAVLTDQLYVPKQHRGTVEELVQDGGDQHFEATVAFGRLGEPWITDLRR